MATDLLGALADYLEDAPTVQAVLTDSTGRVAIFDEVAIASGDHAYPYAAIVHYDERDPGESLDDGLISLTLAVFHAASLSCGVRISTTNSRLHLCK
jgi:hypothetical protein